MSRPINEDARFCLDLLHSSAKSEVFECHIQDAVVSQAILNDWDAMNLEYYDNDDFMQGMKICGTLTVNNSFTIPE